MRLYNQSKNTLRFGRTLSLAPGAVLDTTKDNEADAAKLAKAFPKHILALKDGEAVPVAASADAAKKDAEIAELKKQLADVQGKLAKAERK
jgi:hypothetical protein